MKKILFIFIIFRFFNMHAMENEEESLYIADLYLEPPQEVPSLIQLSFANFEKGLHKLTTMTPQMVHILGSLNTAYKKTEFAQKLISKIIPEPVYLKDLEGTFSHSSFSPDGTKIATVDSYNSGPPCFNQYSKGLIIDLQNNHRHQLKTTSLTGNYLYKIKWSTAGKYLLYIQKPAYHSYNVLVTTYSNLYQELYQDYFNVVRIKHTCDEKIRIVKKKGSDFNDDYEFRDTKTNNILQKLQLKVSAKIPQQDPANNFIALQNGNEAHFYDRKTFALCKILSGCLKAFDHTGKIIGIDDTNSRINFSLYNANTFDKITTFEVPLMYSQAQINPTNIVLSSCRDAVLFSREGKIIDQTFDCNKIWNPSKIYISPDGGGSIQLDQEPSATVIKGYSYIMRIRGQDSFFSISDLNFTNNPKIVIIGSENNRFIVDFESCHVSRIPESNRNEIARNKKSKDVSNYGTLICNAKKRNGWGNWCECIQLWQLPIKLDPEKASLQEIVAYAVILNNRKKDDQYSQSSCPQAKKILIESPNLSLRCIGANII